eukprot:CAMPEP_0179889026 /NCGR_PEP_ID=MMETSP0982-20121206/32300_1 /TAXON_ID=483367 /ORGANISM="non described non described, Strain CCMP 2436" /LENGTH=39 /DNA_ID= /DNA_START= /DNA_END= /DNA_ORIENTATION=
MKLLQPSVREIHTFIDKKLIMQAQPLSGAYSWLCLVPYR